MTEPVIRESFVVHVRGGDRRVVVVESCRTGERVQLDAVGSVGAQIESWLEARATPPAERDS